MKIDMLAIATNCPSNTETKNNQKETSFLSVLDTKIEGINIGEAKEEDKSKISDELVALMSAVLSNLNTDKPTGIDENFDMSKLKETMENMGIENFNSIADLKALLNSDEGIKLLNDMNISLKETMENMGIENFNSMADLKVLLNSDEGIKLLKDMNISLEEIKFLNEELEKNSMFEVIKKAERGEFSKETLKINNSFDNNYEAEGENKVNSNMTFSEYKEVSNSDKDMLLEISNLKNRNLLNNENITNDDNELSILNRIAFSTNGADKNVKETQPLVIREQYVAQDILQSIKYISNNKIEELNVKMSPKDLGEINIKLLKTETESKFIITLSKEDTFSLINDNINEIKNYLSNLDMKIKQVSVEIRSSNQNDFSQNLNQQSNKNNQKEEKRNGFTKNKSHDEDKNLSKEDANINLLI